MSRTTLRYTALAAIALIGIGLGVWYFFLQSQKALQTQLDEGRGFGENVPAFFGAPGSTQANLQEGARTQENGAQSAPARLWQAHPTPVAGAIFITKNGETLLRFIERSSGQILEANVQSGEVTRLTNTLMPAVQEGFLTKDGGAILRFLDEAGSIATFSGAIRAASTTNEPGALIGSYLEKNILALAIHPARREIFYITTDANGNTVGTRSAWNGSSGKRLFSSVISGWQLFWPADNKIVMQQNAADGVAGSAYAISSSGTMSALTTAQPGLTIKTSAGQNELLGTSSAGAYELSVYRSGNLTNLGLATIADKCVITGTSAAYCAVPILIPSDQFINSWYKGLSHTSDQIWKIDMNSGKTELILSPEESFNRTLDVSELIVSENGNYLGIIDGVSGALWSYKIQ